MKNQYEEAAEVIKNSSSCIALTGAGVSVESGIPDFRSAGGLWEKYDPAIYASIDTFNSDPEMVWEMLFDMADLTVNAKPNAGHLALAELEELGYLKTIITQNVDNLHQEAGNESVIEYHGNNSSLECMKCGNIYKADEFKIDGETAPECKDCNKILKPTVIFFGEMIPKKALMESQILAESADVVLVCGTSAVVYPVAGIPLIAKQNGATLIEFNLEETGLTGNVTDIFIKGPTGTTLPELIKHIKV
ncbi:NAD-dependent deacetylase [Spirochaetota bacterium]